MNVNSSFAVTKVNLLPFVKLLRKLGIRYFGLRLSFYIYIHAVCMLYWKQVIQILN
jgi:hypothetical protein